MTLLAKKLSLATIGSPRLCTRSSPIPPNPTCMYARTHLRSDTTLPQKEPSPQSIACMARFIQSRHGERRKDQSAVAVEDGEGEQSESRSRAYARNRGAREGDYWREKKPTNRLHLIVRNVLDFFLKHTVEKRPTMSQNVGQGSYKVYFLQMYHVEE